MKGTSARALGFVFVALVAALVAGGCTAVLGDGGYVVEGTGSDSDASVVDPEPDAQPCTTTCGGDTPVCIGDVCHECAPEDRKCTGLNAMACSAGGKWVLAAACPFNCTGAGVCSGACVPGAKQCQGNDTQTCDATGTWQDADVCSFGCTRGMCTGTCVAGTTQCVDLASQTCDSTGTWKTSQTCPYVCSQEVGKCTGVCVPGSLGCSGAMAQSCDMTGNWNNTATCAQPTPDCQNGGCTCLETACPSGTCADLKSNPQNCGTCAHDCGAGGVCAGGVCQPVVIASGQTKPWGIAVDAAGVYWTTSVDVKKAPIAPLGAPVTLATGQTGAQGIAVSAGVAYWVTYDGGASSGGTVASCAVAGCSNKPATIASSQTGPWAIAVDASNAYWSLGSSVVKAALGGGTVSTVGTESKTAYPLAVDATNAYWADSVGAVFKCALSGCGSSPTTLATLSFTSPLTAPSHGLAIDATNVYFTNDGNVIGQGVGVWKVPIAGGSKVDLDSSAAIGDTPIGVAVDATYVYFANNGSGTIMKAPIAGGGATAVATGQNGPWGIAVDATYVYWTNQTGGTVMRVAK